MVVDEPASRPEAVHAQVATRGPVRRPSDDERCCYVFLFFGEGALDTWDLERVFVDAYGEDEAARRMSQFEDFLVGGEQQVQVFASPDRSAQSEAPRVG